MPTGQAVPDTGYGSVYLDSLIWGVAWTSGTLKYYLASDPAHGHPTWNATETSAFQTALGMFSNVANLQFQQTFTSSDANLVWWKESMGNSLGAHELPEVNNPRADGWFNHTDSTWQDLTQGGYGFITILHELGHGMGLEHPHDGNPVFPGVSGPWDTGNHGLNQGIWTTMTYNDGWDSMPAVADDYGYQGTLMAFDIAALQELYGANSSYNTGDDIYLLPTLNHAGTFWSCIWDAGGVDAISNVGSNIGCSINLNDATLVTGDPNAGGFVSYDAGIRGGFTIANSVVIENAFGGSGNDTLIGNSFTNRLDGGAGNDKLTGNAGSDVFVFWNGYGSDTITDFVVTGATDDEIDVSGLTLVSTFDDMMGYADQLGANTVFNFGSGAVLTLWNIAVTSLTYDDFVFGAPPSPPGPNEAPTEIALSNGSIAENAVGGTVGNVLVTDPNNTAFTFLVSDSRFQVAGTPAAYQLKLISGVSLDYETEASVALTITATDSGGLSKAQDFTINVFDMQGVTITGTSSANTIDATHAPSGQSFSTPEHDIIYGMAGNDVIHGLAGNDTLTGGSGTDKLYGGNGNDTLVISGSNDTSDIFDGGAGMDTIVVAGSGSLTRAGFNAAASSIETWQGNGQAVLGNSSANVFDFSALNSVSGLLYVDGGSGNDNITGSDFADDLRGNSGNDTLNGGDGNDILTGGAGTDQLYGGNGDDTFVISGSNDTSDLFDGGANTDTIVVTGTGSVTRAGFNATGSSIEVWQGNGQAVLGNSSANVFDFGGLSSVSGLLYADGGSGNDTITGTGVADDLRGNSGNDTLNGGSGNDNLTGGTGNDTLYGGANDDTITGGAGIDAMTGSAGADTFVFVAITDSPDTARDTIADFEVGTDKIDLHAIDANTASGATGNQDFLFFGSSSITVANQVTFTHLGGNTIVSADTNGNSTPNIVFVLAGLHTLTQSDFIL